MLNRHRTSPAVVRRNRSAAVLLVLAAVLGGLVSTGCTVKELGIRSLVLANQERARQGVSPLYWDDESAAKAEAWATQMANTGGVSHSEITDGISSDWRVLGENVGMGNSIEQIHSAFMRSPSHRGALLAGKYRFVGVGVAERDGRIYVAQVFRG